MWILTIECNDYNQYGEYFAGAWINKPIILQIEKAIKMWLLKQNNFVDKEYLKKVSIHTFNGGGRTSDEYFWFNLRESNEI